VQTCALPISGPVGEGDPLGVVEERLADVAARLAAVRLVGRVDRTPRVAGTAGRLDGLDQLRQGQVRGDRAVVGGAAVVLDLLQGHDVRRPQVVHDRGGVRGEGVVGGVQVLHVVGGDGEFARVLLAGGLAGRAAP